MKIITKYDICIIFFLLLTVMLSYCTIGLTAAADTPETLEITVDGKLYASYKLNDISVPETVNIDTQFGKNTLKITHDGAEMTDSNCKDRLDVKCGKITKVGQIIICIPNRVTVRLLGKEKVDRVTY